MLTKVAEFGQLKVNKTYFPNQISRFSISHYFFFAASLFFYRDNYKYIT